MSRAWVRPVAVAAAVPAGLLMGAAVAVRPGAVLKAGALAVVVAVLVAVPTRRLWQLALVLFAALPVAWLPVPRTLHTVSPPVLAIVVLALRLVLRTRTGPATVRFRGVVLAALAAWLVICVGLSRYHAVGVGWLISFGVLALLAGAAGMLDRDARRDIASCWVAIGAVLGAYAVLETYVLHANPLYGRFYAAASPPLLQHWSVYRATTSLGHPVDNGIFFALAAPLALGAAMRRPTPRSLLAVALTLGGVASSGSRAALVAAVAGCLLTALPRAAARGRRVRGVPRAVVLLAALAVAAVGSLGVLQRADSHEAAVSTDFRVSEVAVARAAVRAAPVFGVGPGAASLSAKRELKRHGGAGAFESMWLEAAVGEGLPGVLLLGGLLVVAAAGAVRRGAPEVAGALVAYLVAASSYNVLEGGRASHVLLGLLLAMALCAGPAVRSGPRRRPQQHGLEPVDGGRHGELRQPALRAGR